MAIKNNINKISGKLKNVGVDTSQLSSALSFAEKQQVEAIKNVGSLSQTAGKIRGDISKAVSKTNAVDRAAMEIGANLAAKLEDKGVFSKNTKSLVSGAIQSTVNKKLNITQQFPKLPVDLADIDNRIPKVFKTPAEKMQQMKDSILGRSDFRYGGITYPLELTQEAAAYLKLQFWQYTRAEPTKAGKLQDIEYVEWPLPENLTIAHNIKYNERDTDFLGDVLNSNAAQSAISAADQQSGAKAKIDAAGAAFNSAIDDMNVEEFKSAAGQAMMRAGFAGLEGLDVGNTDGIAGQLIGAIPNPHPSVFFKGVELRQFQWTWHFVPRSKDEAKALERSLNFIRQMILPQQDDNFLKYPHFIQPIIMGDKTDMYGTFKKALVSSFSINYTGEGQSAYFVDGRPVSIRCAMTFQETEQYLADEVKPSEDGGDE